MSINRFKSFTHLIGTTSSAVLLLAGSGLASPAFAQATPVTVDLSVLDDGGFSRSATPGPASGSAGLLMPGAVAPRSTYFGPGVVVSTPILSAPQAPVTAPSEPAASTLSTADSVPPPAPEPVQMTTATATVAEPAPEPMPEAPAEATTATVALEPSGSDTPPPPAAPDAVEAPAAPTSAAVEPVSEPETGTSSTETTETAAASSIVGGMAAPGLALQLIFADAESKLPGDASDALGDIAEKIKGSDNLRIQLMAYAGGEDLSASKARRLSLSRALSVRSYFIENGVRSTRIDVRALGDKSNEQPINRVDINIVER